MSEAQQKIVKLLDTKLDAKTIKTITVCAIVMVIAVLIAQLGVLYPYLAVGAESHGVCSACRHAVPRAQRETFRHAGRRGRGRVHYGVVPHNPSLWLVLGQLGRVELLVLRPYKGRYI